MPPNLRYASVSAEVVNIRYRAPASYQSRPAHPPSPAAVKAAMARAAANTHGEEGWRALLKSVAWATYSIVEPLSTATYLVSRLQPPEQRKKGKEVASADPTKGKFKKPSNVFPVGEFLSGELKVVAVFKVGAVPEDLVAKSLLGLNLLGDNDSIVVPKPSTLVVKDIEKVRVDDGAVTTRYVFRLRDASPIAGSWLLAKLPARVKPENFRGTIRVKRLGFEEVVIPAKRFGQVLSPNGVRVRVTEGAVLELGEGDFIIVPSEVVR